MQNTHLCIHNSETTEQRKSEDVTVTWNAVGVEEWEKGAVQVKQKVMMTSQVDGVLGVGGGKNGIGEILCI